MPERLGGKLETITGIGLTAFGVSFGLPIAIIPMAAGCVLFVTGVFRGIKKEAQARIA
jgi:hypothetical protein